MPPTLPLTGVIINFRTPDLLRSAACSFRAFYPATPLLMIDNGSGDQSVDVIHQLCARSPDTTHALINSRNIHHGPAMDQALRSLATTYVLFLDSDCEIKRGGLLERMVSEAQHDEKFYAAGKKIFMNRRGFDIPEVPGAYPYIRPICMLVHRERYLHLPPFERHGAPCLANMRRAVEEGLSLTHIPVEEYIVHRGRGTASVHGYRLGIRGRLNHFLNRLGL